MIDWGILLEKAILILAVVTVSLVIAMYATWAERNNCRSNGWQIAKPVDGYS